jgi:uncharacterized membrane protein (Fun14 family)
VIIPFLNVSISGTVALMSLVAFVCGFILGSGIKHSLKIIVVLLGCLGAGLGCVAAIGTIHAYSPNLIQGLTAIWNVVDPMLWLKELFSLAGASITFAMLVLGFLLGLWRG